MAGNPFTSCSTTSVLCLQCPFMVSVCFQVLLLLIVFGPMIPAYPGIVVVVLIVLIGARNLCINYGKHFYSLPKEMQI